MWWKNKIIINVCVCVAGHQPGECVQVMSWWSSNPWQWPLQNLCSANNCYVIFTCPALPSIPASWCSFQGGGRPLLQWQPLHQRPLFLCIGLSAHLGITCLRPSILIHPNNNKWIWVSRKIQVHWFTDYFLDRLISITYPLSRQKKTHTRAWIS